MKSFLEQIRDTIAVDKEIILVLPRKGIKKQKELESKIIEIQEKYTSMKKIFYKEIEGRYDKILNVKENPQISEIKDKISVLNKSEVCNPDKTSFEKMQLDRLVYDINGYYKKDLNATNKDIYECIQRFKKAGINLTYEDFNISEYVNEYMKVLLEEAGKGNIYSQVIKKKFEEVYWKCSDLIYHILVNIRILYDKYEGDIDKYYEVKNINITKKLNSDAKTKKFNLEDKYNELKAVDKKNILDNFIAGNFLISDYNENAYNEFYMKLTSKKRNEFSEEELKSIDENIKNLNRNFMEYKKYLDYKFINDEVLKIKSVIDKEKADELENKKDKKANEDKADKKNKKKQSNYDLAKNDIQKNISKISKINLDLNNTKKGFFSKVLGSKEKKSKILERDRIILELKELYSKLDEYKFTKSITENIDETSKIYDLLRIGSYNYGFLAKCLISKNKEITPIEITNEIVEIKDFVENFDFSVINNINIDEKKDISIMIKDKYKLIGFNLTKEDFSEANIEEWIRQTSIILTYNSILKSRLPFDDIRYVLQIKDILKK